MDERRILFQLRNITVDFDRQNITRRSLKEWLHSRRNGHGLNGHITRALDIPELQIREGDRIGLIGRNGAGKSTLIRVLTEVIIPQTGVVHADRSRHIVPLTELGIGFQPDLSGRENCLLAGILMGYSRKEILDRMESIIRFSELAEFIDQPVKSYSSGMYARLAFALATDVKPEVLLVDEVFGVGDEFFMKKCIVRMQRLMAAGSTVIFVSHNIDFLVHQCRRLIWLEKGKIIQDGDPPAVAAAFRANEGV